MKWKLDHFGSYADRVRRSSREIVIASVLTLAAFAFLVAALWGSSVSGPNVGHIAEDATIK